MKDLYDIVSISRQALWKYKQRRLHVGETTEHIVDIMTDMRVRHKRMGCRSMYYAVTEDISVGRDTFEKIGFANGFKLKRKPNKQKTTWSQRVMIFPNLIEGKVLNGINQVWQSDIFYIKIEGQDYYGVSIEDVYSRRLLALHFAKDIRAMQVERALRKALQIRKGMDLSRCIFHTDRGSQYISELVTKFLYNNNMQISMCRLPQENSYVERVQGTLKYQYLFEMNLREKNLFSQVGKIMRYYNNERPHSSLQMKTPVGFERIVEIMSIEDRPRMQIFKWNWDLLTNSTFVNKKEKSSKKEKSQITTKVIEN